MKKNIILKLSVLILLLFVCFYYNFVIKQSQYNENKLKKISNNKDCCLPVYTSNNELYLQYRYNSSFEVNGIDSFPNLTKLNIDDFSEKFTISKLIEKLQNKNNLRSLEIDCTNESKFPSNLYNLNQINNLRIALPKYSKIPTGISKLNKLETLTFISYDDTMGIFNLPEDIGELKNLTNLYISNLNIAKLPKSFSNFSKLRVLSIVSINKLDFKKLISKISNLRSLDSLYIQSENITQIPKEIKFLKNIKYLNIGSELTYIHPELYKLKNLKTFYHSFSSKLFNDIIHIQRSEEAYWMKIETEPMPM